MLPSAVNDTMRDMMAQIRDVGDGIRGGTYTMTAPIITGGTITGSTINNSAIGGTTAAAGKFTTLEATGVTTVQAGTVSAPAITTTGDTNTGIFFPAADTIAFTEGGAEVMRIDSAGNLGVLNSNPATILETGTWGTGLAVGSTSATHNITIASSPTSTLSALRFGDGGSGVYDQGFVNYDHTNNAMGFGTNRADRIRITSAGDVGIGNTAPGAKLEVTGAIRSLRSGSTAAVLQVINDNNSWNITSGTSTSQFRIDNNLVGTALTINNNGAVALAGASQTASGVGITFPATQSASSDANTLDDYEEGTWTPTIIGTTVTGTASYTQNSARYTKIGRMVFVETYISWSGGTGSGALRIAGLPFTSSATETYPGLVVSYFENIVLSASNVPMAYFINNNTAIGIYQCPVGGGANSAVTYDAAGGIQVSGCYTV
jgi:hypothetical protein